MRVYDRVMDSIERINSWIMENIEMLVSEGALAVFFEIGLDNQSISFEYFGYRFDLVTSAVSWNASTKTLFTATLSGPVAGLLVSAGITAKVRGDAHRENLIITGEGSVTGDDWDVRMKLDPLMKGGRYLLVTEGEVRGTDISVVVPELEDYHEFGVSLRDIEGIGHVLDNIPLPIPGTKASVDAGFSLKYSAPSKPDCWSTSSNRIPRERIRTGNGWSS